MFYPRLMPAEGILFFVFYLLFFICTQASAIAEVSAGKKVGNADRRETTSSKKNKLKQASNAAPS